MEVLEYDKEIKFTIDVAYVYRKIH